MNDMKELFNFIYESKAFGNTDAKKLRETVEKNAEKKSNPSKSLFGVDIFEGKVPDVKADNEETRNTLLETEETDESILVELDKTILDEAKKKAKKKTTKVLKTDDFGKVVSRLAKEVAEGLKDDATREDVMKELRLFSDFGYEDREDIGKIKAAAFRKALKLVAKKGKKEEEKDLAAIEKEEGDKEEKELKEDVAPVGTQTKDKVVATFLDKDVADRAAKDPKYQGKASVSTGKNDKGVDVFQVVLKESIEVVVSEEGDPKAVINVDTKANVTVQKLDGAEAPVAEVPVAEEVPAAEEEVKEELPVAEAKVNEGVLPLDKAIQTVKENVKIFAVIPRDASAKYAFVLEENSDEIEFTNDNGIIDMADYITSGDDIDEAKKKVNEKLSETEINEMKQIKEELKRLLK